MFCHWTPDLDHHGYYLGDYDWSLTFYSLGTHYPIGILEGIGGWIFMDFNPGHFLGAPLLAEVE